MAVEAHMYRENLGLLPFAATLDTSNDPFCFDLKPPQQQLFQQQLQHPLQFQPPPPPQQQQQQFVMPQQDPQHKTNNNFVFSAMKPQPHTFSQTMTHHAEKQRREIDGYIHLQNERLKMVLQQQRKQQLAAMLRKLEARTASVMRQKQEEIAQAAKRNMELQQFMKRLEMENQTWKRTAAENESLIANLNAAISQLREKATLSDQQQPYSGGDVDDAESCCDENDQEIETGESESSKRRKTSMSMVCRSCNSRNSSVLFLPCRHLCCCTACEAFVYACPVCNSPKKGTIEALFS